LDRHLIKPTPTLALLLKRREIFMPLLLMGSETVMSLPLQGGGEEGDGD